MTRCRFLSLEVEHESPKAVDDETVTALAESLNDLAELENELSLAQRWVQGRITEIRSEIADELDDAEPRLATELVRQLADTDRSVDTLSDAVDAPRAVVRDTLERLARHDVVERTGRTWTLRDA